VNETRVTKRHEVLHGKRADLTWTSSKSAAADRGVTLPCVMAHVLHWSMIAMLLAHLVMGDLEHPAAARTSMQPTDHHAVIRATNTQPTHQAL
jgi:hypothetical protein